MKHLSNLFFRFASFSAFAHSDTTVTNTVELDGSGSNDIVNANGWIDKYQWTQVSDTTTPIANSSASIACLNGIYIVFEIISKNY